MSIVTSLAAVPGAELRRAAGAIVEGAADITLLVDGSGVIRSAAFSDRVGRIDVATVEGMAVSAVVERRDHAALEALIAAVAEASDGAIELRHLPPVPATGPVRYTALRCEDGAVLLVGRVVQDAGGPAGEPSALIAERGAGRRRAVEAHYQALFETAVEAVVIVSPASGLVEEANPRALAILAAAPDAEPDIVGRRLAEIVDRDDAARLDRQLTLARDGGEFPPVRVRLAGSGRTVGLDGRVFRAFDRTQLMLRVVEPGAGSAYQRSPAIALVARLVRESHDALALTDSAGRVIWTNRAFDTLAKGLHGRTLAELTEFSAPALDAILLGARERGRISLADARLHLDARRPAEGRLTVIALPEDCAAGFGLVFRPAEKLAATPDEFSSTSEIGAEAGATLKELLRDATDVIERSCIDAALKLTGGNRAAAAKVLGISRQSLYVKMRHFGLI